ncbi:hypothetical protein SGUI_1883 [Serinicoccus hydrothermalis]|uniref:Uncharacterized protein n=1 Tax=Serinicoccus hydrothermalis TaxID=1758689 RepID=A0A1B1NCW1_9MICO|nr:hypothetical protein [Serinicoccus hydrothermalis]ANS79279.1 hypothetical protein SGUI_1883 [Serinicoccus hydrothermalis]
MPPHPPHPEAGDPHPAEEHDPTGVRALLAGLPDPGPMPAHLVDRITARLEVEREHRDSADHPLAASADHVVDLAAERGRRRPARTLGILTAAAAGLAVTTVAFTQVFGGGGGVDHGAVAQYPSRAEAGADDAGAADQGGDGADGGPGAGSQEESQEDSSALDRPDATSMAGADTLVTDVTTPTLLAPLGEVPTEDYALVVHEASERVASEPDAASQGAAGELTHAAALQCWGEVEQLEADAPWSDRFAATATLVGEGGSTEEVVLLLGLEGDRGRAWAVPADCMTSAGVAPLDPAGERVTAP